MSHKESLFVRATQVILFMVLMVLMVVIVLSIAVCISRASSQVMPTAHFARHGEALLPDPDYTPGLVRTTDKNDPAICGGGSTKKYREAGIRSVYRLYGVIKQRNVCCEIDHLISLELGGDNGVKNEWPQPYEPRPGAYEKDEVENWLHAQVCAGKLALPEAQKQISTDWYAVYVRMNRTVGRQTE